MKTNRKYGKQKFKEELRKISIDCCPSGGVSWLLVVAVSRKRSMDNRATFSVLMGKLRMVALLFRQFDYLSDFAKINFRTYDEKSKFSILYQPLDEAQ